MDKKQIEELKILAEMEIAEDKKQGIDDHNPEPLCILKLIAEIEHQAEQIKFLKDEKNSALDLIEKSNKQFAHLQVIAEAAKALDDEIAIHFTMSSPFTSIEEDIETIRKKHLKLQQALDKYHKEKK